MISYRLRRSQDPTNTIPKYFSNQSPTTIPMASLRKVSHE